MAIIVIILFLVFFAWLFVRGSQHAALNIVAWEKEIAAKKGEQYLKKMQLKPGIIFAILTLLLMAASILSR